MLVHDRSSSPSSLQFTPQCYYSSPRKSTRNGGLKSSLNSPDNPSRLASLKRLQNPARDRNAALPAPTQLAGPGMTNENLFSSALFMPIYSTHQIPSRSSSATDESGTNSPPNGSTGVPVREILYSSSDSSKSSDSLPQPVSATPFQQSVPLLASNAQELRIDIGGIQGYLNWDALKYDVVDPFFNDSSLSHSSSLSIDWKSSRADAHGWRAVALMKELFHQLGYRVMIHGVPQIALSAFTSLSISIPDVGISYSGSDTSRHIPYDSLSINIEEARNLREFNWQGDLYVLATIFKGVPSTVLTTLTLTRCIISDVDAVSLLHACPRLAKATLESITPPNACPRGNLMTPSSIPEVHFQSLTDLCIRSSVPLMNFFERNGFPRLQSLDLDLDPVAAQDVDRLAIPWSALRKLRLNCGLTESQYRRLQSLSPRLRFKVTKVQG